MSSPEDVYLKIGEETPGVVSSRMFGVPCLKYKGKAFASYFQEDMVFRLHPNLVQETLKLEGTKLFDPSGKNRPMKAWVQVPYSHVDQWKQLAYQAIEELKAEFKL
ncbi:MAG: hypothetical protein HRT74_05155 [Flavobacteriales bacterium]|nr:hypothetical protein [Flavobacteriales bacterium]